MPITSGQLPTCPTCRIDTVRQAGIRWDDEARDWVMGIAIQCPRCKKEVTANGDS